MVVTIVQNLQMCTHFFKQCENWKTLNSSLKKYWHKEIEKSATKPVHIQMIKQWKSNWKLGEKTDEMIVKYNWTNSVLQKNMKCLNLIGIRNAEKLSKKCTNCAKNSSSRKIKMIEKFIWNSAMSNKKQSKKSKSWNFKKQSLTTRIIKQKFDV